MTPTITQPVSSGAPPVEEDGKLILRGRIKDTAALIQLHSQNYNADRLRASDRALIQQMLDNFPPVATNRLRLAGKGNCSNVNWGDGERVFLEECAPYIGLGYSGRTLFTTPTRYGNTQERARWSQIIAEEATSTIRVWKGFLAQWMLCVIYYKRDGMSFAMFQDPINWQWEIQPMEFAKIPNHTKIGTDNIEYVTMDIEVAPYVLYSKIKDPVTAEQGCWNVAMARRALMDACPDTPPSDDWERWEEYWKNNDYLMGTNTANKCRLLYGWVREVDGSISQYITRREDAGMDFILKAVGRFHSMDQFLHIYIDNLGSNGTYHSIRGLGHRIYSKVCELNRKINKFSDAVEFDSTPIIQTNMDVEQDEVETIQWGAFNIFPSTYTIPDRKVPNYEQTIIPALGLFRDLLNNSSNKKAQGAITENPAVSRYVLDAVQADAAQVSGVSEFLFYSAAEKHYREVLRRLCAEDYDPCLPGGAEAADFRRRCFERGVPVEAIYKVDFSRIQMVRVIGGGNNNVRAMKLQSLIPMSESLDPVGKNRFQHDLWSSLLDEQAADYYCPIQDTARLPDDAGIAQVENWQLIQGAQVVPLPGQNDEVHCLIHLQKCGEYASQVEGQSLGLLEVTVPLRRIVSHVDMHIANLPPEAPSTKQIIETREQLEGMIANGELQLQRIAEQQAKAQAEAGPQGQPMTPEQAAMNEESTGLQLRMAERSADAQLKLSHQAKMMAMKEAQEARKMERDAAKLAAEKALLDLQTAQEIRRMSQPK